jgi:hypothetical protein
MGYPFVPNGRPDQLRLAAADIVGFGRSGIVVSHKAQTSHTDTTHPAKYNSCGRCFNLNFFYDEKLGMNSSHVMPEHQTVNRKPGLRLYQQALDL